MPSSDTPAHRDELAHEVVAWVPKGIMDLVPPVLALLALDASPAFAISVFAMMAGSAHGLAKAIELQKTITWSLAALDGVQEATFQTFNADLLAIKSQDLPVLRRALLAEQVVSTEKLLAVLSAQQREQVAVLVEEYMRTQDEERLVMLRRVLVRVVRDDVAGATRHAVIANLRTLAPEHLRLLHTLSRRMVPSTVPRNSLVRSIFGGLALHSALIAAGFIRLVDADHARPPRSSRRGSDEVFEVTPLGAAALRLVGPFGPAAEPSPGP